MPVHPSFVSNDLLSPTPREYFQQAYTTKEHFHRLADIILTERLTATIAFDLEITRQRNPLIDRVLSEICMQIGTAFHRHYFVAREHPRKLTLIPENDVNEVLPYLFRTQTP